MPFRKREELVPYRRACELTQILEAALQAFLGVLDRDTLADLLSPAPALKGILMIGEGNA